MKLFLVVAALAASTTAALALEGYGRSYGTGSSSSSHYVRPHVQRDGDFVSGHYRTNPDSSRSNNYGAYGNYNSHDGGLGNGYGSSRSRW